MIDTAEFKLPKLQINVNDIIDASNSIISHTSINISSFFPTSPILVENNDDYFNIDKLTLEKDPANHKLDYQINTNINIHENDINGPTDLDDNPTEENTDKPYNLRPKLKIHNYTYFDTFDEFDKSTNIYNPKYGKKYRLKNKEKIKEYKRKYRLQNREKINKYVRKYYIENKEKILNQKRIRKLKKKDKDECTKSN